MEESKKNTRVNVLEVWPEDLLLKTCSNNLLEIWGPDNAGEKEKRMSVSEAAHSSLTYPYEKTGHVTSRCPLEKSSLTSLK